MQVQPKYNEIAAIRLGHDLRLSIQTAKTSELLTRPDLINYELFDGESNHIETLASLVREYDNPQVLAEVCTIARKLWPTHITEQRAPWREDNQSD